MPACGASSAAPRPAAPQQQPPPSRVLESAASATGGASGGQSGALSLRPWPASVRPKPISRYIMHSPKRSLAASCMHDMQPEL